MNKSAIIITNFFLIITCCTLHSQVTNSPYTLFGSGQVMDNGFGISKAMGGTGIAIPSKYSLNNLNPASYSGIDSSSFIFEIGVYGKYTNYKSSNDEFRKFDGNLRYLAMGFRFCNWWAGSLGVVPYSAVNYNIRTLDYVDGDLIPYYKYFGGTGGINQFYFSNSINLGKHIAFGINSSYIMGSVTQTESTSNIDDFDGYTLKKTNYINSFSFDYGLLLNSNIGKWNYRLGVIYGNHKDLKTNYELNIGTIYDTFELKAKKADYIIPERYGVGISMSKGENICLGIDYSTEKWSVSKFTNHYLDTRDGEKYSFGLEYHPAKSSRDYGYKILYYRLGGYYQSTYLIIDNTPVNTQAVTFGIGLPMIKKPGIINISGEIGQTGSIKNGLIRENYVMMHLNFSLRDIWFQKPKYD